MPELKYDFPPGFMRTDGALGNPHNKASIRIYSPALDYQAMTPNGVLLHRHFDG